MTNLDYTSRYTLLESFTPETGAEVGVCEGEFSKFLLSLASIWHLYLIDPWQHVTGTPYELDHSNVDQGGHDSRARKIQERYTHEPRVTIKRMRSIDAAKVVTGPLDFVFIDAAHYFNAALQDLIAWAPLTKNLFCHDYFDCPPVFGVKSAVESFLNTEPDWNLVGVTREPTYQTAHLRRI